MTRTLTVKPKIQKVLDTMADNPSLVECMKNFEGVKGWKLIANDLVFKMGNNKLLKDFVQKVHSAKIEVEREMRSDLNKRILSERPTHVVLVQKTLGKDLNRRLKLYVRAARIQA